MQLSDDAVLFGAEEMAKVVFLTAKPTTKQVRKVRYLLTTGGLKAPKLSGQYAISVRALRAQFEPGEVA
jgi:hypothetical protein